HSGFWAERARVRLKMRKIVVNFTARFYSKSRTKIHRGDAETRRRAKEKAKSFNTEITEEELRTQRNSIGLRNAEGIPYRDAFLVKGLLWRLDAAGRIAGWRRRAAGRRAAARRSAAGRSAARRSGAALFALTNPLILLLDHLVELGLLVVR